MGLHITAPLLGDIPVGGDKMTIVGAECMKRAFGISFASLLEHFEQQQQARQIDLESQVVDRVRGAHGDHGIACRERTTNGEVP